MKNKFSGSLAVLVALSVLGIAAVPARASDTDNRIESAATNSYVFRTYLKGNFVKAEAKDGAVTLTGTVEEASYKSLAETTVANLPGVISVDNQLKIKTAGAAEQPDVWLSTKVRVIFMFHRNVNGSGTDVFVTDGVVTLRGEAPSMAQKELCTECAKDVEGVKDVINEMTIAQTPALPSETTSEEIDDASITAQVKTALMEHHSTSAVQAKVSTMNGMVALTGVAKNDAERALVTKLASDIKGVMSVVNNMTIVMPVAKN